MIELIESIVVDVPREVTEKEIVPFIEHQLKAHYPAPDLLVFDYVLTGRNKNRSVLVTYIQKNDLRTSDTLLHPHLLVKHGVIKNGTYLFPNSGHELLIDLKSGKILHVETDPVEIEKYKSDDIKIISDDQLNKLYKRCKKDLFLKPKKRVKKRYILPPLLSLTLILPVYMLTASKFDASNKLSVLQDKYDTLLQSSSEKSEEQVLYDITLEEVVKMESHINPSVYLVLTELGNTRTSIIIKDIGVSGDRINLTVLTKNSLELLKDLNRSEFLKMELTNTVPGEDLELSQFTGEIICP